MTEHAWMRGVDDEIESLVRRVTALERKLEAVVGPYVDAANELANAAREARIVANGPRIDAAATKDAEGTRRPEISENVIRAVLNEQGWRSGPDGPLWREAERIARAVIAAYEAEQSTDPWKVHCDMCGRRARVDRIDVGGPGRDEYMPGRWTCHTPGCVRSGLPIDPEAVGS